MIRSLAQLLYWTAHYSGFNGIWIRHLLRKKDVKLMLNYHHILNDEAFVPGLSNGYSHRLSAFDAHMKYLSEHYPVSLDIDDPHSITISFDDGTKNNYTNAFPVLEKYGIKAWFFLNDRHQGDTQRETLWIDWVYEWLTHAPPRNYKLGGFSLELTEGNLYAFEAAFFNYLAAHFKEKDQIIHDMRKVYDPMERMQKHPDRFAPMTEAEIVEMQEAGHQFGFHTQTHQILSGITSEELKEEISIPAGLKPLLQNTDILSVPFGFPNTVNQGVYNTIFEHGYRKILLNEVYSEGPHIRGRVNMVNATWKPKISSYLARWPLFLFEG